MARVDQRSADISFVGNARRDTNRFELTRELDSEKAASLDQWANQVGAAYNVLPMDTDTFRLWAKFMHKKSDSVYEDAMIAATAARHKLIVATRNERAFRLFPVDIFNPFA